MAAALNGRVYVINALTHQPLPGWKDGQPVVINGTLTGIDSSPAVAYLDGPNRPPSIVVGAGSLWDHNQNGGLVAFNTNGTVRFVVHTNATFNEWGSPGGGNYDNSVFSTPAVGDFQGIGQQDIVFGSYDHRIYAVNPQGKLLPGFPIQRADTIWSSAVLADTTRSGRDDLIIGGDSSGLDGCYGGWLTDYRWGGNGPQLVWEHCIGQTIWSSPTVGMLNSSGREAVVVGTSWNLTPSYLHSAATHEIFAWYTDNGAGVPGWPVSAGGSCNDASQFPAGGTFGSPVIAQITASSAPVVVSTSHTHCMKGPAVVSEWSGSGRQLWSTVFNANNDAENSPAVVDLTGDGVNDVVVGNADGLVILNGENGGFLYGTNRYPLVGGCDVSGVPAFSAVPGLGGSGWEMVYACGGPALASGTLVGFDLPHRPAIPPGWAEWRANPQRSGVPDPIRIAGQYCAAPRTPAGFRIATAMGQELTGFGNLPYCGDAMNAVLPAPVVASAATPNGGGYWLLLADGAVYPFGDAKSYGDARTGNYHRSAGLVPPGAQMTGIASTKDGKGYYLTDADGDVYAFGDAAYQGSRNGAATNGEVVGITLDRATEGYWLVTSTGDVYGYHAANNGCALRARLDSPIVAMAATPSGGYWLTTRDGRVYGFGVKNWGSITGIRHAPIVGLLAAPNDKGYYLVGSDGGVYRVGEAVPWYGSGAGRSRGGVVVGAAGP